MQTALDRRTFLAFAAAAIPFLTTKTAAAGAMFVSLNSSLTRRMDWKDFVPLAARLGYGGVDVDLTAAVMAGAAETRDFLASRKIKPGVASLPVRYTNLDAGVFPMTSTNSKSRRSLPPRSTVRA